MKKSGFTIVEISVVMVVIGLLIAGVLVGQSLIGSAKMQALAKQINEYDVAIASYVSTYGQLPGDSSLTGIVRGNGDGLISNAQPDYAYDGYSCASSEFYSEIGKFWYDLSHAGLIKKGSGGYLDDSNAAYSGSDPGVYLPKASAGQNAFFIPSCVNDSPGSHIIKIAAQSPDYYVHNAPAFPPEEVLSLDTKLDNGKPNGNIYPIGDSSCYSGNSYTINNENIACVIVYNMGFTAGKHF